MIASAPAHAPCSAATRECQFWNWGEGNLRPECCTEHMLELIAFAHELLDEHGILHWLDYGTLLGAVRDGELIPWDWDADFGILAHDADAVLALRDDIEAAGHHVYLGDPATIRIYYSEQNQLGLDLWMWHERGDLLVSADDNPLVLWPGMHDRASFPVAFVERPTEVELHGMSLPAPSPVEVLLADHRYGPDWQTPVRPIVSLATKPVVPSEEMTDEARELLPLLGERDAVLRGLLWNGHSGRLWSSRAGSWFLRAGLPLEPEEPGADEPDAVLARTQRSLAWTELAISELEHPTRRLAAARWQRRATRLARRVL
jgi:hypothetical protein